MKAPFLMEITHCQIVTCLVCVLQYGHVHFHDLPCTIISQTLHMVARGKCKV